MCVSLNRNNAPADVPTNRPMSLEELEGLFARAIRATAPGQNPVLPIGGRLLTHYIHNDLQKNLLSHPGQAIAVNPGKVTAARVDSRRDLYVNALLIQSRGQRLEVPCTSCQGVQGQLAFPECRHVPGAFGGACGNCKWPDHGSHCSVQDENWKTIDTVGNGQPQRNGQYRGHLLNICSGEAGAADNQIDLDEEEEEEEDDDDEEGGPNNPIQL